MTALSQAPIGGRYEVRWNLNSGRGLAMTERLGIVPGAKLRVIGSYFGSVIVEVDGRRVALDQRVAGEIRGAVEEG